jgi:hypothetical protein
MNKLSKGLIAAITLLSLPGMADRSWGMPTVGTNLKEKQPGQLKTSAAQCNPATATIDLDINNIRARLMTGGDMWWDRGTGTARYEIPKGSGKHSLYAGSVWVGGRDPQNQLKVAAQMYRTRGNDYWPGPTLVDANNVNTAPDQTVCSDWDRFWKIDRATLNEFIEMVRSGRTEWRTEPRFKSIVEWPATGNVDARGANNATLNILNDTNYSKFGRTFAPFVDFNKDGIYKPEDGDYPDILGDQYIWWVFNDMGNVKGQTQTTAIGMEVQTSSFAFATKDYLNDASFVFYKLINRGTLELRETYMATWTDADLGYAFDDFIGCDTARSLGILYNGKSVDGVGSPTDYGSQVPMIGVDFFIGPKRRTYTPDGVHVGPNGRYNEDTLGMAVFNYFVNEATSPISDPTNGLEIYRVMTGFNRVGAHIRQDQPAGKQSNGYNTIGPEVNFVYWGEPDRSGSWAECQLDKEAGDRRFVHSSGPFTLEAGGITNDIIIGACWVPNVGGCPKTNFSRIRAADDAIQDLFDNKFQTIEGPEAPRMVVREMDRSLIVYLVNDSISTNFQERFGDPTAPNTLSRVSSPRTRREADNGDSLYHFEGYRVFQLLNKNVTSSQIFNEAGEVDSRYAAEVFQTDIANGVSQINNHVSDPEKGGDIINTSIKVRGKDSGIQHSFVLNTDAFASGDDRRLVNYKNYYFVAIAYSYNNYANFTYEGRDTAQLTPYLESAHGAGRRVIPIVVAMPNPANGDMGTVLNSAYGSGVVIKRLEGIGNGNLETSFDAETEQQALQGPDYQAKTPTYAAGYGPVSVKVVDPRKVQAGDWELYIRDIAGSAGRTSDLATERTEWMLKNVTTGDTMLSERRNLSTPNEQIWEKYGLSVNIINARRATQTYSYRNGAIASTITYANPNVQWLWGVQDGEEQSPLNWIRAGNFQQPTAAGTASCDFADAGVRAGGRGGLDTTQFFEQLLAMSTPNRGTWAPVPLTAAAYQNNNCDFGVRQENMPVTMEAVPGVDIVFTSDKTKWSRVAMLELQDNPVLADGRVAKFGIRSHRSWDRGVSETDGRPTYVEDPRDTGRTWFPGYAINQETGERLNIVLGEDSYLKSDNGDDLIWNPSKRIISGRSVVYGGRHFVWVLNTKYDEDKDFIEALSFDDKIAAFRPFSWLGIPTLAQNQEFLSLKDGLIPNETRLRFRITWPYNRYVPNNLAAPLRNNGYPLFTFNTNGMQPTPLSDAANAWNSDKDGLLKQIHVTPNPYYGYNDYEESRLDTKVRIVNLPRRASIYIYAVDGTLIRTLTKDNENQSYIDWDTRNAKGLSIASGMYLFHVKADGIGETTLRWFGAFRPTDVTTY